MVIKGAIEGARGYHLPTPRHLRLALHLFTTCSLLPPNSSPVFECTPPQSNYDTTVLIDFAQYARLIVYTPMHYFLHQAGGARGEVV